MRLIIFLLVLASAFQITAQKPGPLPPSTVTAPAALPSLTKPAHAPKRAHVPSPYQPDFRSIPLLLKPGTLPEELVIEYADQGLPTWIRGTLSSLQNLPVEEQATAYLQAVAPAMRIREPAQEWVVKSVETDELGHTHIRYAQHYEGLRVWNSEIIVHANELGHVHLLNGRYYPTPQLDNPIPTFTEEQAALAVEALFADSWQNIGTEHLPFIEGPQMLTELVIYHTDDLPGRPRLAWFVKVYPNVMSRYECIIDAHTGELLLKLNTLCKLVHRAGEACSHQHSHSEMPTNGPATTTATDLMGQSRTINTYKVGSNFFLIDGSRPMFSLAQSSLPDDPVGAIWTLNANNTSPELSNFNITQITSATNNYGNNPKAVSAHYNAGVSYEYFRTKFNRNSINGQGGTIISIINVAESDGSGMENAFWNGQAMFYGNGGSIFAPLAKSLDVAGHEMSHGVIEKTANLTYQNESGALNESFADIFGSMMDPADWKIGEDIVLPGQIPTGALRDLSNPNNGGSGLQHFYWQPKHYNERYTGTQDNGGVHINSGIPNHAYYKFATSSGVGNTIAEQVFYRALTKYLVAASKFIDLRASCAQAISDLGHGAAVLNACNNAFTAVGIGSGGSTGGGSYQVDIAPNPGSDIIMYSNVYLDKIAFQTAAGQDLGFVPEDIISRPSVTDDGSEFVWIGSDKRMYYMSIDWSTGQDQISVLQSDPIWRNVAISKDGWLLAAITDALSPTINVYSFETNSWKNFTLTNPTTAQGGISTGDVKYADILEFDLSGQYILYDAYNELSATNLSVNYWDIGILHVWDNSSNNFANGFIDKLFNQLPANSSVGNPTFAKNSLYIIAFDFISGNNYTILGANIQTGAVGTIFENNDLGFPSYSRLDDKVIFNRATASGGSNTFVRNVNNTKISGTGNATQIVSSGYLGVWFANGERQLPTSDAQDLHAAEAISVYPNPAGDYTTVRVVAGKQQDARLAVYDAMGRQVFFSELVLQSGANYLSVPTRYWPQGIYSLAIYTDGHTHTAIVVRD